MPKLSFRIEPFFLILAFGLGWLNSPNTIGIFIWAIAIFISILIHELGHALTALFFKQSAQITFMAMGGLTTRAGPPLNPFREFLIVLNGPLAGFGLYFLCRYLLDSTAQNTSTPFGYMLLIGTWINLVWTILNLFPVLPLDGGRLMMIVCEKIFGGKGSKIAYGISLGFAALFGIFFFLIQEVFAGAIFLLFAFESYRAYTSARLLTPIDEDENLKKQVAQGIKSYNQGDIHNSEEILQGVREKTKKGVLYLAATFYLAKALEEQNQFEKAYLLLSAEKKDLNIDQLESLQQLAFATKQFRESAQIGQEVFQEKPGANPAYINALSLAQLGEVVPSVGWFETAIREGLEDPLHCSRHHAFDPIRQTPEFKRLTSQLT